MEDRFCQRVSAFQRCNLSLSFRNPIEFRVKCRLIATRHQAHLERICISTWQSLCALLAIHKWRTLKVHTPIETSQRYIRYPYISRLTAQVIAGQSRFAMIRVKATVSISLSVRCRPKRKPCFAIFGQFPKERIVLEYLFVKIYQFQIGTSN